MAEVYVNQGSENRWNFYLYSQDGTPIVFSSLTTPQDLIIQILINNKLYDEFKKSDGNIYAGSASNECFIQPTSIQTLQWPIGQITARIEIMQTDTTSPAPPYSPTKNIVTFNFIGYVIN